MPEMPEVEAFKYIVKTHCLHKIINNVQASNKKVLQHISIPNFTKKLTGNQCTTVERRGKYLLINLLDSILVMHFGLTGFLVYSKKPEEVKFTRVLFTFNDKSFLHWISIRLFEKIWLVKNLDEIKTIKKLGPDPLKMSKKQFINLIKEYKTKNIKAFLMDQAIISGVGNEYSDEILFQSGIDPHHKIKDLSEQNFSKIYAQMQKILKYAIALRIKDIKKLPTENFFSNKDRATFKSSYLQAHRHTDMQCPKNKSHTLKKVTIAGRSTYYCPKDQT